MFPKYLEKTANKKHSSFLFGNTSSQRVFKEYQRLRNFKDNSEGSQSFYPYNDQS